MKVKTNNLIVLLMGIYFFSLGVLAVVNVLVLKNYSGLLWMCYFGLLFIGIGMLFRNSFFILAQLNILFIPLIFWNLDFFYKLFTGETLWGITDYFFIGRTTLGNIITLQHLYIIPLALFAIYLIGLKRRDSWKLSFFEILLVFFAGLFFTSTNENVNCIFSSCVSFVNVSGILYNLVWFGLIFSMIIITNFLIVLIFKKGNK